MAKRGVVVLPPRPESKITPIHGADLAEFCRDVMSNTSGMWDVGGLDQFTYREVVQFAFAACGKAGRTVVIPPSLLRAAVSFRSHLNRRSRDLLRFFVDRLTQDTIGQRVGVKRPGFRSDPTEGEPEHAKKCTPPSCVSARFEWSSNVKRPGEA